MTRFWWRGKREITAIIGVLVALLGLTVLIGWYTDQRTLIQVLPQFVPMQYNTALGFVLSGLAVLLMLYGSKTLGRLSAGFLCVLGGLTLFQYLSGVSLGIDEILMKHYVTVETSHPGRMAPNTAICFVLAGAFWLLPRRLSWMWAVSGLLLGLSLIALFGYIGGVDTAYHWGKWTSMAVHTSIGFFCLSVGYWMHLWLQLSNEHIEWEKTLWFPATAVLVSFLLLVVVWQSLEMREYQHVRRLVDEKMSLFRASIDNGLAQRHRAFQRMRSRWEFLNGTPKGSWLRDASNYYQDLPGWQALEWVDTNYRVRWIVPMKGNEAALHLNLAAESSRHKALEHSKKLRKVHLTKSIRLVQGGWGFLSYYPLYSLQTFQGFLLGVFRYDKLFASLLPKGSLSISSFRVWDGKQLVYQSHPKRSGLAAWKTKRTFQFLNARWTLEMRPHSHWINLQFQSLLSLFVLMGGGLAALLLGGLVRLLQHVRQNNDRLEALSDELTLKNRDLETLLYICSHDLREPLRSIHSYTNLIRKRYLGDLSGKGLSFFNRIGKAARRLEQLLEELLQLTRVQQMERPTEEAELLFLVTQALERLEDQIKRSQAKVTIQGSFPSLRVDETWVVQAIFNLLTNAFKFTKSGEAPNVTISPYYSVSPTNEIHGIVVDDCGPGIDEAYREKVFLLFQRAVGREIEGTGAGLAIVKQVAERHGGRVWIEDRPSGGVRIIMTLETFSPGTMPPMSETIEQIFSPDESSEPDNRNK